MATLSEFISALRAKSATRIFKIELLDSATENVVDEITDKVIEGSIQLNDSTGARRSATIKFSNVDGTLTPSPSGIIWIGKKVKISTGLIMSDSSEYYVSKGIYVVSEPEISTSGGSDADDTITIQFLDKWSLINKTLENTYIIPVSSSIKSAVEQILSDAGEIKLPLIDPAVSSEITPHTILLDAGQTYGELLQQLAKFLSYTCFYDENGYFRFEARSNLDTTGSKWSFSTNEVTYLSNRHRYEFTNVYNNIIVIGQQVAGVTIRGTASDTSPTSPTRISLIGKLTKVIEDDLISSTPLANQRAEYELLNGIALAEVTDINTMCVDILEGGDIIDITDVNSDLSVDRFIIKNINMPLTIESDMTISGWQGRSLE